MVSNGSLVEERHVDCSLRILLEVPVLNDPSSNLLRYEMNRKWHKKEW